MLGAGSVSHAAVLFLHASCPGARVLIKGASRGDSPIRHASGDQFLDNLLAPTGATLEPGLMFGHAMLACRNCITVLAATLLQEGRR